MARGGARSWGGPGLVFWLVIGTVVLLVAVLQWILSDQLVVKILSTVAAVCYYAGAVIVWRNRRA